MKCGARAEELQGSKAGRYCRLQQFLFLQPGRLPKTATDYDGMFRGAKKYNKTMRKLYLK